MNRFLLSAGLLTCLLSSPPGWSVTATAGPTLTMDPNGITPLAGVIQLSTDAPARVTVQLSSGGENRTIEFAEFRTDFSLPLLGLKPDRAYTVEVVLTDQQNQKTFLAPPLQAVTDPLPVDFPQMNVLVSEPGQMEPGYTMMARFVRADGNNAPTYTIIVDNQGEVVWYSTLGDLTNYQLPNGNILYRVDSDVIEVDLLGNEVRRVTLANPGAELTHDMYPSADQTYLSITIQKATVADFPTSETDPNAPTQTADVEDNPIVEFDLDGNLLNVWPLVDMLDTSRIAYNSLGKRPPHVGPLGFDWVHVNAVIDDPRDDSIIFSARHQDALVKFSRSTGELKWILGTHANWSPEFQPFLLTPVGAPFEWQYHQHAPMITPSGTIVLFDNGNHRASPFDGNPKTPDNQNYSRAVEYAVDEERMEVRQVWEYGGNIASPLYDGWISDANWLKTTGNVLITFGANSYIGGLPNSDLGLGKYSASIIEVTHETPAQKVFELSLFDPTPNGMVQIFRSERIPDLYPVDRDADGVPDYLDNCALQANGPLVPGDPATSQLDTDADGEGDVCDIDDDGDGISDRYEIDNLLDPLDAADASLDKDGDGLTNLEEFRLGSAANKVDSDGDGIGDGAEVALGRSPVVNEGVLNMIIELIVND